jgi:tetratricopeptide (TPR) repeat protein
MAARSSAVTVLSALLCTFAISSSAFAQQKPSGGAVNTTNTSPRNSRPNTLPAPTPNQQLIYNGKIMVSGPALTDAAKVIAKCNGSKSGPGGIYSAYSDLKGNFSLTLGQTQSAVMDASVDPMDPMMNMGRNSMQMTSCEVTASASGYISSQITVQIRSSLDITEVGKLILQPFGGGKDLGGIVSVTTLSAPESAQHEYAKGIQDLKDNKYEKAEKHFLKATSEFPKFAVAWEKLGQLELDGSDRVEARASFQKAIDSDPKYVPPYLHLALMNAAESKWKVVLDLSAKAISVDPQHFPEAYFLNGAANYNLGDDAAAEKSTTRADEMDKQHAFPRIQLLLAEICNRTGHLDAAAEHFRRFLELAPNSKEADVVKGRLAKLEMPPSKQ